MVYLVETEQVKAWTGEFGSSYTKRNYLSVKELDDLYLKNFGVTRTDLNKEFLGAFDHDIRILEVGSNVGNQLRSLQHIGFTNLWGLEVGEYAVEMAKKQLRGVNLIRASASDIPYKDRYFDLVFTSGLLIHIHPNVLPGVMDEIFRVTKRYIWCHEYFAEVCEEVHYRGRKRLLWKNNFSKIFLERYPALKMIKERRLKYKNSDNVDVMFMLNKK